MSALHRLFSVLDHIAPAPTAYAHCDIPCGIYDPHHAQMAAHTVIRMVDLIEGLPKPTGDASPKDWDAYVFKVSRHTAIKEQHAEIAKHEVRILWGDYFKPEHAQAHPDLHEAVWKVMKLGSKGKQELDKKQAEDLLQAVNTIAEIFWKTKGVDTATVRAPYPTEKSLVVPKLG